jgi:hypothetical protein
MPDPFCLFSILSISGTHVRQAKSDHVHENSIFDMETFTAAQGAAVPQPFGSISDLPTSMDLPAQAWITSTSGSQQTSIFTTQAQARCAGSDISMLDSSAGSDISMSDPFCLSTVLPTFENQVRQAESDQSSANSIFDMGIFGPLGDLPTVITSTGKVISNVIPGHEESDQQNLIDADPSLLASGYNSGALGSDRLSPNQDSARARGAWALDRLEAAALVLPRPSGRTASPV